MNVLSIDFDVIMAPDISLYNHLVSGVVDENDSKTLEKITESFPMLAHCRADLGHYAKIFLYLMNNIQHLNPEDIRVAYNHEDIKYILSECKNAHVFNIDHHHDLGYPIPDGVEEKDICTCANWGDYFLRHGTITHFTWLKNTNSDIPIRYDGDERITFINFNEFELNDLPKIDKLFICLSPEWVSSNYFPLFYLMLDYINNQKNCRLQMH